MFFNLTISVSHWYYGAPGRSRTCGLRNRNPSLYPTELRVHMVGQANPVFISSAFLLPVFSIAISCRLFHRVFCFHSLAIIFGSLPDWVALILRTAPEFIRGTEKTTILSNRFIGLQFLLCKADGLEKNYVMICYACNSAMIFQACTSGNSFQQVVKAGLRNLLRALQSELPETEAEATV